MDKDKFVVEIGKMMGMSDEEMEIAELEVTATTIEAEESLKRAIKETEEQFGKKAFVAHDGEVFVNLTLIESLMAGVARAFIPEVIGYAFKNGSDSEAKYMEGRLAAVNSFMTIWGALVTVAKEHDVNE